MEKQIVSAAQENSISPNFGSKCVVHLSSPDNVARVENVDLNTQLEVTVGDADSAFKNLLNDYILTMREGEICSILVPNQRICSKASDTGDLQMVTVIINLLSVHRHKEVHEYSAADHIDAALKLKNCGTTFYQNGNTQLAFNKYSRALKHLLCLGKKEDFPGDRTDEIVKLKTQCYLNLAACQLSVNNYHNVITNCTSALQMDAANTKGLYRRGQAYIKLHVYEKAVRDMSKALEIEPGNKAIDRSLRYAQEALNKQNEALGSSLSKMFVSSNDS